MPFDSPSICAGHDCLARPNSSISTQLSAPQMITHMVITRMSFQLMKLRLFVAGVFQFRNMLNQ